MDKNTQCTPLSLADLEPFLKLPSGLPYLQAKQHAKVLKQAQDLSQSEAQRIILWGNGLPEIRDVSQAFPEMCRSTFGLEPEEFGLLQENETDTGYFYRLNEGYATAKGYKGIDRKVIVSNLVKGMVSMKRSKGKEERFLSAVIDTLKAINDPSIYYLSDGMNLECVQSVDQIGIEIRNLLGQTCSGGEFSLRYALASCYNTNTTKQYLVNSALENLHLYQNIEQLDLRDNDERNRAARYFNSYSQFGEFCSNLDQENKSLIKRLLDNYSGW